MRPRVTQGGLGLDTRSKTSRIFVTHPSSPARGRFPPTPPRPVPAAHRPAWERGRHGSPRAPSMQGPSLGEHGAPAPHYPPQSDVPRHALPNGGSPGTIGLGKPWPSLWGPGWPGDTLGVAGRLGRPGAGLRCRRLFACTCEHLIFCPGRWGLPGTAGNTGRVRGWPCGAPM